MGLNTIASHLYMYKEHVHVHCTCIIISTLVLYYMYISIIMYLINIGYIPFSVVHTCVYNPEEAI